MKRMESCPEKDSAVAKLIERMEASGLDNASIARMARITTAAVWHVKRRGVIPRWSTIDKINRGLNRWEASK